MKPWLGKNDKEMYWQYNAGKSTTAGSFIRILKNKNYKYMTSVSKNVYIDKLDDIVDKYNDTYHITIKIKPVEVKSNTYNDCSKVVKKLMIKILNLKWVIMLEYQNIIIFLKKFTLQIDLKKFLWWRKLKVLRCGHMLLIILKKKFLECFAKNNCKKQIKKSLEL